jgi:hypothetical protein
VTAPVLLIFVLAQRAFQQNAQGRGIGGELR